jgi:hypothetical protein
MRATASLSVKGIRHYKAAELLQKGSLASGLAIRLEHQPTIDMTETQLPYGSKHLAQCWGIYRRSAAKFAALLTSGQVIEARITNIAKDGEDINIVVLVVD